MTAGTAVRSAAPVTARSTGRLAAGTLSALAAASALVACAGERQPDAVATSEPAAAAATTPSSIVRPAESYRPWQADGPSSTTARPSPGATATGVTGATVAPADQVGGADGCDIPTIARDVGEQGSAQQMILGFCDGRWAQVSLQSAGLESWAVREGGQWTWLQADGYSPGQSLNNDCYRADTLAAHQPVPAPARENLPVCDAEDVLYADAGE